MHILLVISIILNVLLLCGFVKIFLSRFVGTIFVNDDDGGVYMELKDADSLNGNSGIVNIKHLQLRSNDNAYNEKED